MTEIECAWLAERVTDYLDGALAPAKATAVTDHLRSCDTCLDSVDTMRRALAVVAALPPEPPSPEVRRSLQAAFREWAAHR